MILRDPAPPRSPAPLPELLTPPDRRWAALGAPWSVEVAPQPVPGAHALLYNETLAQQLGLPLDWLQTPDGLAVLSGQHPWPGYGATASVYAGHQFGNPVRQLGDGRALLIAEITAATGHHTELQLKGSGPTPWSRGLDGRCTLGSALREYLASEAMAALGVPTTRALSLTGTGLVIERERPEPAAVLCRTAPGFVRFGHLEYHGLGGLGAPGANRRSTALPPPATEFHGLLRLADQVIAAHWPDLAGTPQRHGRWLTDVLGRTARLIATWQTLGFCHGVMNTDNFSVLGLTLDYGPFGFMERFRDHHVCNPADGEGRYAYGEQARVGRWNCERLLDACLPLLAHETGEQDRSDWPQARALAQALLPAYSARYNREVMLRWRAKLGLATERPEDQALLNRLLTLMQAGRCDFTRTFRALALIQAVSDRVAHGVRDSFARVLPEFDAWVRDYRARLVAEGSIDDLGRAARMHRVNPLYVPRQHLLQQAVRQAEAGDLGEARQLLRVLRQPCKAQPGRERYAAAADPASP
ncbi:hypothetical protein C7444_11332 [Sphaerotilus hippei]|uniref:Protein nucleotidyltransferase YdiU n=1 Tax=Sphaerotilus hippei TaxID=744406 RepID=A0A318GXP2_9BURK|nr:YdiU family protein [Sphaerotilus hippei]PXW94541.1 hypothetical protein C7444_11332 [Sphaerotilus hippei]